MELYSPDLNLTLWSLFILLHLILCIITIIKIINDPLLERKFKLIAILAIILTPVIGFLISIRYFRNARRQITRN